LVAASSRAFSSGDVAAGPDDVTDGHARRRRRPENVPSEKAGNLFFERLDREILADKPVGKREIL